MRFSQRQGYAPVKELVQRESMDDDLRIALWNVLDLVVWKPWRESASMVTTNPDVERFVFQLWHEHFKLPADGAPSETSDLSDTVRKYFFECRWYAVYDLLEFVAKRHPKAERSKAFVEVCNSMLQRELSAYRFVGNRLVEITSEEELGAIEEALQETASIPGAQTHLRTALDLLADRDSPDYRNSIKESISAVESLVGHIGGTKATLGSALKQLGIDTHPALNDAFNKLYGYTSDAQGIRHALMAEPDLQFEDAKFMLVSCSAFVNYLKAKAARAGVGL